MHLHDQHAIVAYPGSRPRDQEKLLEDSKVVMAVIIDDKNAREEIGCITFLVNLYRSPCSHSSLSSP
jgi:hypothetical protein